MAENTEEEYLGSPTNTQPDNPSDDIISTQDTETINPNQEILSFADSRRPKPLASDEATENKKENMEVHKHPHHVTHKKKWGEYLLEFLMLFLAVFLGFLAENLREQSVEHHREKEYIHSLIEDLKSDTLQSNEILIKLNRINTALDSVMAALASPEIIENSNNAYYLWSKNIGFPDFLTNDRTIQQLKNSGGLRLIRNKAVSDSIMKYDQVLRNYYGQADIMNEILVDQHIYSQLFDFINLNKNKSIAVPLTEQGRKLLNEAYANRKVWKICFTILIAHLKVVNEEGKIILQYIQKEYDLK